MELLVKSGINRALAQRAQKSQCIAGRLALFRDNWRLITTNQWVLNTIQGYGIAFTTHPVQHHPLREGASSTQESLLLEEEIQKLLAKGAIVKVPYTNRTEGFYSSLFLVQKKVGLETHYKPQGSQRTHPDCPFQDGGDAYGERPSEAERLAHEGGSEGLVLYDPYSGSGQAKSPLSCSAPPDLVHLSTIRPFMRSMGLYQYPEAGDIHAQRVGDKASGIHRRYTGDGRVKGPSQGSH